MNEDKTFRRRARRSATVATAVLLLAGLLGGCDTAVIAGTARVATPDVDALDAGAWQTTPPAVPPNDNDTHGRVIESARLGEAVAHPRDIDPALAYGGSILLPSAGRTSVLAPEIALEPVATHAMIAGYSVVGVDGETVPVIGQAKAMRLTVLRFRDESIAASAAREIAAAAVARNTDSVALSIPGYATAYSHWQPQVPVATTTVAYRSYVIVVYVMDRAPDAAALGALTGAALTAELPLLDAFQATPPDELSALPLDGDDMLRRLLHPDSTKWPYPLAISSGRTEAPWSGQLPGTGVVYGPRGLGHLFSHGPESGDQDKFSDEAERVAFIGMWWLVRTSDAIHARRLHLRWVTSANARHDSVAAPENIPDAACFRQREVRDAQRNTRFFCHVLDGRYWAVVAAADEQTMRQRAAAQYALLVNSR
ncbi:DUF7373 family lipoprotein [Nocardia crassostreae]|uniref:DUF7373 family lipoprotein n=1 Tax=Nocardia crassostreae TaxID=53428 RepID=UPI00082A95A5|nr:hypothetical protein [Nocardia crassostreae]